MEAAYGGSISCTVLVFGITIVCETQPVARPTHLDAHWLSYRRYLRATRSSSQVTKSPRRSMKMGEGWTRTCKVRVRPALHTLLPRVRSHPLPVLSCLISLNAGTTMRRVSSTASLRAAARGVDPRGAEAAGGASSRRLVGGLLSVFSLLDSLARCGCGGGGG